MKQVTIYTLGYCPYCKKAKNILRDKNIPFNEIDVTSEEDSYTKKLKQKYKIQEDLTFPQIIFGENRIGGCSDLEIIIANNQLENLLNEE